MADPVQISNHLPDAPEWAPVARYEGDTVLYLLDGDPIPQARLVREAVNLKGAAESFPEGVVVSVPVASVEAYQELFDLLVKLGMVLIDGTQLRGSTGGLLRLIRKDA